jgi:hypothetical protein
MFGCPDECELKFHTMPRRESSLIFNVFLLLVRPVNTAVDSTGEHIRRKRVERRRICVINTHGWMAGSEIACIAACVTTQGKE